VVQSFALKVTGIPDMLYATAFDVVETHSAKFWLGALCVDRAFSFMLLQSPGRLTDDSSGEWLCG
jgi:hypothetical protein